MSGLGLVLLALGITDLICGGVAGRPKTPNRCVTGLLMGGSIGLVLGLMIGLDRIQIAWLGGAMLLVIVPWLWFRRFELHSAETLREQVMVRARNTGWALAWIAGTLLLVAAAASLWALPDGGVFQRWLDGLPYTFVHPLKPQQVMLGLGVLVCQFATANATVRTVLIVADPALVSSEQRLRGGRLIGIIERLLIFGMAAAGQLAAAAFIASAKSILRFPELSRIAHESTPQGHEMQVDATTEYFLLGSLTSWFLALAPVLFF